MDQPAENKEWHKEKDVDDATIIATIKLASIESAQAVKNEFLAALKELKQDQAAALASHRVECPVLKDIAAIGHTLGYTTEQSDETVSVRLRGLELTTTKIVIMFICAAGVGGGTAELIKRLFGI